ncbi:hypothetical protein EGK75_08420 [Neisseria weixii]|uniref:Uncharacterized protein n=1 Tax=Neisseria weixii TaxID=1853276 RepID=A0A3N4MQN1_9NEIS|nr:VENN motif pre-toxin domain-containing protein [Neisseria weixii]RPD86152.1 hypothetical protein EGK74_08675 [Neisseria weixii]RPD86885.1 hypothetical protein EGK75_08420 [Neisseria weixii]
MNAHPTRTFSSNRQKAAAEDKAKAEAEFEGRLKARNDGSYEAFSRLSDSERQAVLISESEAYRHAGTEARNWGIGGSKSRAVNAGTILLTGILGGKTNLQTAANTLSPYAAAAIGNTFGHGANQNETAQLVGHFVLGATLAYINGGDPLSGGSAAVAAEKSAQYLSQQYNDGQTAIDPQTGEFNPNLLPEHIKDEIKSTTGVIAAIVGATGDGGAALNAQIGGVLGQNAVENNDLVLQGIFSVKHPLIAAKIGSVSKNPSAELNPNISTIASTFQLNLFNIRDFDGSLNKNDLLGEGGVGNAYRHTLWQAIITKKFGKDIAAEVGDAHESRDGTDYSKFTNLPLGKADELADQMNNRIGREIAQRNPNASNKQLAEIILNEYSSTGLFQAIPDGNDTYMEMIHIE